MAMRNDDRYHAFFMAMAVKTDLNEMEREKYCQTRNRWLMRPHRIGAIVSTASLAIVVGTIAITKLLHANPLTGDVILFWSAVFGISTGPFWGVWFGLLRRFYLRAVPDFLKSIGRCSKCGYARNVHRKPQVTTACICDASDE